MDSGRPAVDSSTPPVLQFMHFSDKSAPFRSSRRRLQLSAYLNPSASHRFKLRCPIKVRRPPALSFLPERPVLARNRRQVVRLGPVRTMPDIQPLDKFTEQAWQDIGIAQHGLAELPDCGGLIARAVPNRWDFGEGQVPCGHSCGHEKRRAF